VKGQQEMARMDEAYPTYALRVKVLGPRFIIIVTVSVLVTRVDSVTLVTKRSARSERRFHLLYSWYKCFGLIRVVFIVALH